jgi:four helix bundle protein
MKITKFEEIDAWKAARRLAREIFETTEGRHFDRDPSLLRQMRSTTTSIMANIAEGFDSASHAEFSRFLKISRRSATELQSHLYVGLDRGYLDQKRFDELYKGSNDVKNLISGFLRYLKSPKLRT